MTGSAWISRGVIALVQLFSIRILLEGLGGERYAVFVLLNAFIAWYMLADMGIGASLQNHISEDRVRGGDEGRYQVLGALVAAPLLALTIGLLYLLSPNLSNVLFKPFPFMGGPEKARLFFISGMLFLGLAIGSIAYKVWYAQHKGHLSNIIPAIGAVIGLGLVSVVMHQRWDVQTKLIWGVVAFTCPATLFSLGAFVVQLTSFSKARWRPDTVILPQFIARSLKFWLLALLATAALNVDYLIISQYLSPHEIVVYGVTSRLFGFVAYFYTSLYAALWPLFTEAITRNNWKRVKVYIVKAFLFSAGIIVSFTLFLLVFMPSIANLLSPREKLDVPLLFILLLGIYHLLLTWSHGFAVVLQSMSDVRFLVVWGAAQALLSMLFQVLFVQLWGIYGITLGLIASFVLTAVWVIPNRVRRHSMLAMDRARRPTARPELQANGRFVDRI